MSTAFGVPSGHSVTIVSKISSQTNLKKQSSKNPWITRDIIHIARKTKRMRKRKSQGPLFQKLKKTLSEKIRSTKHAFYSVNLPQFLKSDPTKFWLYIKTNKQKNSNCILLGDQIIRDEAKMTTEFNCFFHSVYSNPCVFDNASRNCAEIDLDFITFEGSFHTLLNIKTKSSCGPDNIPDVFLRRYAGSLSRFLVIRFRLSLSQGIIPADWRIARVIPIFKKRK